MSDDDDDIDKLARAEINKLHRKYRLVEAKRKAYCEESEITIKKQNVQLQRLKNEKEELKRNLMVAQSKRNIIKDNTYMEELSRLLQEQDFFKQIIKEEKGSLQLLDKEIDRLQHDIITQNKAIQGLSGTEQAAAVEKQIRTLENRLEKSTQDYNKMLTVNSKMREEIEHLRIQRSVFDDVFKKLKKKLNEQKKIMQNVIDQSTQAYDQRDDAQAKIQALKEKNEKDLAQYNSEYRDLMRIIDHDAKLKSFMNTKAHERNEAEEEMKELRRAGETDKAERTAKEMIEKYEESFKKIREITGEKDMYSLVKRFVETEEKNYALFTYINELNTELKIVEGQIEQTRQEIRDYNETGVQYQSERQIELRQLEKKLEETKKEEERFDAELQETESILEQLKSSIGKIFTEIKCDGTVLSEALGDNEKVTEDNILQYLSLIEQKTNELLQVHAYLQLKELENKPSDTNEPGRIATSVLGGPGVPPQKTRTQIQPPPIEDNKADDADAPPVENDEFDAPFSPEEIKRRAGKNAVKLEQAQGLA